MMNTSLASFLASLKLIGQYVTNLERKNLILDRAYELPCATQDIRDEIADLQSKRGDEKQFDYSLVIVALYGQYETFVEKAIKEYVKELHTAGYHFSQLPTKMQTGYFSKGISLHGKLAWEKYKHLNEKIIAQSLHESLNQNVQNILAEAFYTNAGNYKIDILVGCLGELGIENAKQRICQYPALQVYYQGKYGVGVNVNEKDDEVLYGVVDEVVETRNRIAHTGKVDEIKDNTYVKDMLNFFEKFATSLNSLLQDALYETKWNASSSTIYKPVNVFNNHTVAGFLGVEMNLHVSQDCICNFPEGVYPRYGETKILGIEENGVGYQNFHLDANNPNGIGVLMGIQVSQGCLFKFI